MHEIVTVSVSHRANHLTTQFFNGQEQALYAEDPLRQVDKEVVLNGSVDRIARTVSYTPRALLWEALNGFGALGTHQYDADPVDYFDEQGGARLTAGQLVQTRERLPRSKYQLALDAGEELPRLSRSDTRYWSDYNKMIYAPLSFNSLKNWSHDVEEPNIPCFHNLKQRRFDLFEQGREEFGLVGGDFLDDGFRLMLEQCNTLQGVNLITDLDSGWGGFSAELLEHIRDDLPKSTIFSWGFNEPDAFTDGTKRGGVANKLRSTLALRGEADLFFPLYADVNHFSNWEIGGMHCRLLDTVVSLSSQQNRENKRYMTHLVNALTDGDRSRNIVSTMNDTENDYSYHTRVRPFDKASCAEREYHEFSYCSISRSPAQEDQSSEPENKYRGVRELRTFEYSPSDTIPEQFNSDLTSTVKLAVTEKSRDLFKHWYDYTSRYIKFNDDREELKDDTMSLAAAYEHGWFDDGDSGDDDA
ncbi:Dml1p KNAG_0J01990 [Huiozyma naganishii CBS 8797]|uniref:Protein DML1 n=1 Tax=Huiozyma naganishii (strain ATCC MYA-139 / BCRC 22969 / CBS 8797 / KCTC 17520 / NBRC 10181 / NCYC 3082 / Yp74L-3) TaxID=1071383 RepID=J7RBL8_HUIN7|nr:hypothetical protein KNAG_0J01990 [Kazachstania naganishii CBS 8797]CCK72280.1 hypothetical protein KNAG_0J01990 [Kazachstania naganishii CBS 8797]